MIHPTRLQIALAKNSQPSSQRNRLVSRSSELLAVSQESTFRAVQYKPAELPELRSTKLISTTACSLRRLRFTNQNP